LDRAPTLDAAGLRRISPERPGVAARNNDRVRSGPIRAAAPLAAAAAVAIAAWAVASTAYVVARTWRGLDA
jgi:hypothetical protein